MEKNFAARFYPNWCHRIIFNVQVRLINDISERAACNILVPSLAFKSNFEWNFEEKKPNLGDVHVHCVLTLQYVIGIIQLSQNVLPSSLCVHSLTKWTTQTFNGALSLTLSRHFTYDYVVTRVVRGTAVVYGCHSTYLASQDGCSLVMILASFGWWMSFALLVPLPGGKTVGSSSLKRCIQMNTLFQLSLLFL